MLAWLFGNFIWFFIKHYRGTCGSNRGNAFTIAMVEIKGKLNKTSSNKWVSSDKSSYDYEVYHSKQFHDGKPHSKKWAHYQGGLHLY